MTIQLARNPILALAAIVLSGSIAVSQQTPAPPAPPDASAPQAAPIERHPPSDRMGPGMRHGMGQQMGHGPMRPGMMQGQRDRPGDFRDRGDFRGQQGDRRAAGFHIAPPGMWWKSPMVVQRLTLTPEQTKKMDDIFQQSRIQLIDLKANVEKQQVLLEPILGANPVDTAKAMAQIDKVAQSRADLEKANARMLLGIRGVLTPDQWTRLRDHRGPDEVGPKNGPGAQSGPPPAGGPGRTRGMRGGGPAPNTNANTNNLVEPNDQP
jgi:Spy/CpxP family protein refolding chaperone